MIHNIAIYTDYTLDESYTPQLIVIKASTSSLHNHEMHIVAERELQEPRGWIFIPVRPHERQNNSDRYLKTAKLIIEIRSSHQSGRDTHIRQIKIYAPHSDSKNVDNMSIFDDYNPQRGPFSTEDDDQLYTKAFFKTKPYSTLEIHKHSCIR